MQHHESKEQSSLIQWIKLSTKKYPDLAYLHCSLNGVKLSAIQANVAKSQGMIKGVPDLFLPLNNGIYSGIFIEMKYGKNKTTPEQDKFLAYVTTQGYYATVCYSWIEAKDELVKYLEAKIELPYKG